MPRQKDQTHQGISELQGDYYMTTGMNETHLFRWNKQWSSQFIALVFIPVTAFLLLIACVLLIVAFWTGTSTRVSHALMTMPYVTLLYRMVVQHHPKTLLHPILVVRDVCTLTDYFTVTINTKTSFVCSYRVVHTPDPRVRPVGFKGLGTLGDLAPT